ncbi:ribonuclease H-like domain-containing protein [Tanacetum coccineum]
MAGENEFHDDNPPPPPPPVTPTQQAPHTLSTIKLPILKKGEGLPPKTAEEILARERERKARTTLLMSILEDHLAKFHKMTDAKEMWKAIKSRFGGNDESTKMQKYILKQQFESFFVSSLKMPIRSFLVFESDVKGSTTSSSSTQNVAFISSESNSSTNDGDEFDLEEMDLKWQVAMIFMRLKKFYKNTRRKLQFDAKEPVGFDKTKEEPKALVTIDGDYVDWTGHAEDEQENFTLMDYSNSCSNTEVTSWSKECKESYAKLKKLYDEQSSSKGFSKLLNSQMSVKDKSGLGSSDVEDSPVNDRFAKVEGMHAVPPPMTGIYMPPKSDFGIDELNFTYGPKQSKTSESAANTSDSVSCESNSSVETLESVPKPAVNEPKAVSKPKVWSDAPIIEEYESDSDDEYVIKPSKEQEKPSFAFVNTVKHVKTPRETVKEQNTCSPSPKADKRDWNGLMSKKMGLGYGFTKKACFVCGSFSHLIRDCDFHEKRMAKQVELNKKKGKGTGQGENRPVWNNVQRLNHQNKFVPKAVLTKTGIFPVNTARQNLSSQAAATSTARKINTARPIVNKIRPRSNFYKSHSPIRKPSNRTTAPKANFANHKVNTAGDKTVSAVGGNRETADDPQKALKNKGIVDSGCSRHMTGNKAYLVEYQDYNGGPVAFGGSKGQITGKAVSTACYVLNRVLVIKPQNKTPYELITGKIPIISYIRPFGCHVTILNTIDHLGKFEEKSDEGFLVGYSLNSKAFRVYNLETKRVEENLHINFLENKPNVAGKGPNWLFDLDYLTDSMNYQPVTAENKANKTAGPKEANHSTGTQDNIDAGNSKMEAEPAQEYFVLPLWSSYTSTVKSSEAKNGDEKPNGDTAFLRNEFLKSTKDLLLQAGAARATSTNTVNTVSTPISTASPSRVFSTGGPDLTNNDQDDSQIPALEDIYDNPMDGI